MINSKDLEIKSLNLKIEEVFDKFKLLISKNQILESQYNEKINNYEKILGENISSINK